MAHTAWSNWLCLWHWPALSKLVKCTNHYSYDEHSCFFRPISVFSVPNPSHPWQKILGIKYLLMVNYFYKWGKIFLDYQSHQNMYKFLQHHSKDTSTILWGKDAVIIVGQPSQMLLWINVLLEWRTDGKPKWGIFLSQLRILSWSLTNIMHRFQAIFAFSPNMKELLSRK